jgi:hypothetical protein
MADKTATAEPAASATTKVNWDGNNMKTCYANVCNVSSTREGVTLLFGMNQAWHTGQKELAIQLSNRVILSPFGAKRLVTVLNGVVGEYERRFGFLNLEVPTPEVR